MKAIHRAVIAPASWKSWTVMNHGPSSAKWQIRLLNLDRIGTLVLRCYCSCVMVVTKLCIAERSVSCSVAFMFRVSVRVYWSEALCSRGWLFSKRTRNTSSSTQMAKLEPFSGSIGVSEVGPRVVDIEVLVFTNSNGCLNRIYEVWRFWRIWIEILDSEDQIIQLNSSRNLSENSAINSLKIGIKII